MLDTTFQLVVSPQEVTDTIYPNEWYSEPGHLDTPIPSEPGHFNTSIPLEPVHLDTPIPSEPGHFDTPIPSEPGHLVSTGHLDTPIPSVPRHLDTPIPSEPGHLDTPITSESGHLVSTGHLDTPIPSESGNLVSTGHLDTPIPSESVHRNTNLSLKRRATPTTTSTQNEEKQTPAAFKCKPLSAQHKQFLKENTARIGEECSEFMECTEALYGSENFLRILAGKNIQLHNICGLLYENNAGQFRILDRSCSRDAKKVIKDNLRDKMDDILEGNSPEIQTKKLTTLKQCLHNNTNSQQTTSSIDSVCRLKTSATHLCKDKDIDEITEDLFNHELEQLHCTCRSLAANEQSAFKLRRIAVTSATAGIILIVLFVFIFVCFRHRKLIKQLREHKRTNLQNSMLPDTQQTVFNDTAVYFEIEDALKVSEKKSKEHTHKYHIDNRPPMPHPRDLNQSTTRLDIMKQSHD